MTGVTPVPCGSPAGAFSARPKGRARVSCGVSNIDHRLRRSAIAVITVAAASLAGAGISAAADDPNATCLDCHGAEGIEASLKGGQTFPAAVDPRKWTASVHGQGGLSCTDCHSEQAEVPHPQLVDETRRDFAARSSAVCEACHEGNFKRQLDSVHQRARAAGNPNAAVCVDCHNPHQQTRLNDTATGKILPSARVRVSRTCGVCHTAIDAAYRKSVHGAALIGQGNPDVPTCIDCHGVHNIGDASTVAFRLASPMLCASCHTDPGKMKRYGLSTAVLRTYVADFHGTTVTIFAKQHPEQQTNKPVCTDCHGVHDIVSTADPQKGLRVRANLLHTCQRCHPQATVNFPDAWLSHYFPDAKRTPLVYWTQRFYALLIPGTVGGMLIWVGLDFVRTMVDRRRRGRRQA